MKNNTRRVTYTASNSYETLNELNEKTKNVWIVLHGIGYLSRYFLKPFHVLDTKENYIIAPQAPSKYYLKDDYKYVGASWLTKEDTLEELENIMAYLDAVLTHENLPEDKNLVLFGFSQGVSIISRFMVKRKLRPSLLVLYAGGIPHEFKAGDLQYLDFEKTKIKMVYGDQDQFLTPDRLQAESKKTEMLFGGNAEVITFAGGHELRPEIIKELI